MSLIPGTRLGIYEVTAKIGEDGKAYATASLTYFALSASSARPPARMPVMPSLPSWQAYS